MRTKAKLIAPRELEPRAEHPHRCTAGHRWQHDGPAATTCALPIYDAVSGDLPFVGPEDCPVCSGRNDLLVRKRHTHYCNICDGNWEHEGRCLDSLSACCPWCFPKPDAEAIPGERSGPHFHVCAECGQNWRHATGCGQPLRTALPDCPWCQSGDQAIDADSVGVDVVDAGSAEVADADTDAVAVAAVEAKPALREPSPAIPSVGALAERAGWRIGPMARAIGIAALVLLPIAIVIVLRGHSAFKSLGEGGEAPARGERLASPSPAPAPPARPLPWAPAPEPATPTPPPLPPAPAAELARSPVELDAPATRNAPSRAPTGDRMVEPRVQEPRPPAMPPAELPARPEPVRHAPAAAPSVAPAPRAAPASRAAPAPSPAPAPSVTDTPPAGPPEPQPSVARSELAAEVPARAPESPPARSESDPTPAPVRAMAPSIPGAPFGGLTGSSGFDTSLDGHPHRANR